MKVYWKIYAPGRLPRLDQLDQNYSLPITHRSLLVTRSSAVCRFPFPVHLGDSTFPL